MVLRMLGQPLTLSVGAHDSHGCSHGSNAFCRPRHGLLGAWRSTELPACGVRARERREANFAMILHQGHLEEAMETCRLALRGICEPLDVMTSICALYGSQLPGDPFAKGEARLRDPTVLDS